MSPWVRITWSVALVGTLTWCAGAAASSEPSTPAGAILADGRLKHLWDVWSSTCESTREMRAWRDADRKAIKRPVEATIL